MLSGGITSAKSISESHFEDESMGLEIFGVERTVHDEGPAHEYNDSLRRTGELRDTLSCADCSVIVIPHTDPTKELTDTDAVVSNCREAISDVRSFS